MTATSVITPGPRCFGKARSAGGVYAVCGSSPFGMPIEHFLLDPPVLVPDGLELPDRGVTLHERDGVWHIIDRVGLAYYPNVADFIEEARRLGVSRRLQSNLDFSKLTEESRLLLIHPRAWIDNWTAYRPKRNLVGWTPGPYHCPGYPNPFEPHTHGKEIDGFPGPCAGIWWEDVSGGEPLQGFADPRIVNRIIPICQYQARRAPDNVVPQYREAFFASFPIHRLDVVADQSSAKAHELALVKATAAKLDVELVDE